MEGLSNPLIAELIATEECYINTLNKVVSGYMVEYFNEISKIPVPEDLKKYDADSIFGNITEIHDWHKNYFLEALKDNSDSFPGLSKVFIQNKSQFDMYQKYISNIPISNYLIEKYINYFDQIQKMLKQKNSIKDFIRAPAQRICRFKMLLNEIVKQLTNKNLVEDANCIKEALTMIENCFYELDKIPCFTDLTKFDGILLAQGKLLHCGSLMCTYNGKLRQLYVFIFRRLILFTKRKQHKYSSIYKSYLQIPINMLELKELNNSTFSLQVTDPNKPKYSIICESNAEDLYTKWIQIIKQQIE